MTELTERTAIVAEAMTWMHTPYHHRAKLKGVGADCAQFVLAVYQAVGLIAEFDTGEYPHDWHLHRDVERYLSQVEHFAGEISPADAQPGDVLLFKVGRTFSHGAIVTAYPQVIHASLAIGKVTLADADRDHDLISHPVRCFSYWSR